MLLPGLLFFGTAGGYAQAQGDGFTRWVEAFRQDALRAGIPAPVLDDAFAGIQYNESVIKLDRKQPESTISFSDYVAMAVSEKRVKQGRELLAEHRELLQQISAQYGVQPQFIIALWGIETSYGVNKGSYLLVEALASLAYEGRRAAFFREELMNTLRILAQERRPAASLVGSWAGAMGNCQFMPSSYLRFAVDWDRDGRRDIWDSLPDTFASIANYLSQSGWDGTVGWGREVVFPDNFNVSETSLFRARTLAEWRARGITAFDGAPLPDALHPAFAVYPGEPWEGGYLVSSNYNVLLRWNRSRYFATSVGILADRIAEEG